MFFKKQDHGTRKAHQRANTNGTSPLVKENAECQRVVRNKNVAKNTHALFEATTETKWRHLTLTYRNDEDEKMLSSMDISNRSVSEQSA